MLDVKRRVLDEGEQPHVVAGEFDIAVADLFRALAYYDENRERFQRREWADASTRADGEERTQTLLPAQ